MSLIDEANEERRLKLKEKVRSILGRDVEPIAECPVKIDDMYFQIHEDGEQLAVYVIGGYSIPGWQPLDSKTKLIELRKYYPKSAKPPNACD